MNPERIKERLRHILHLDETPHELAKAFAVGVFVAFMPTLGFHTVTVLALAWAFRLNKFVALTGTFVNNPWTIAFVFIGPTWTAMVVMRLLGFDIPPFHYETLQANFFGIVEQFRPWQPVFWHSLIDEFRPFLTAFFVGTTLAGVVAGFAAYFLSYAGIKFYRLEKAKLKKAKSHG